MLQYKLYCGWFEGFHIAIHCIVLEENQCIAIGSRLARCIAIHCLKVKCIALDIVLQEGLYCRKTVLQYILIVPGLYCRGLVRRLGHNTKFCIVTVGWARWAQQARRQAQQVGRAGRWSARGEQAAGN